MDQVELAGIVLEYTLTGPHDGPVVVLPHARPFVRWYDPLVAALGGHRVLRYRRPAVDGLTIERDAALLAALLEHVGVERPHVVGHSYGGLVALTVAMRCEIRSLALIEPATTGLLDPDEAAARSAGVLALAADAGATAAMGAFLAAVGGDGAADELDRLVPGATADAMAHAAGFFGVELPAVVAHEVGPGDVAGIDVPVLNVVGSDSAPRFAEGAAIVQAWLPAAERCEIPAATHLLVAQRPDVIAGRLEDLWQRISS